MDRNAEDSLPFVSPRILSRARRLATVAPAERGSVLARVDKPEDTAAPIGSDLEAEIVTPGGFSTTPDHPVPASRASIIDRAGRPPRGASEDGDLPAQALPRRSRLTRVYVPSAMFAVVLASTSLSPTAKASVLAASPKPGELDLKVQVALSKTSIPSGGEGEAVITLTPPSGVHLNRYPPIRLTVEPNPPVSFPQASMKVGLDAMPKNMEENAFETVDPIHLKFNVARHGSDSSIPIKGKLRYTYCVARSGYCAPGTKDITFTVPVSAQP